MKFKSYTIEKLITSITRQTRFR